MHDAPIQFDTVFYEIYALLVAEQINPGICNAMIKWESPDWKDDTDHIGLEVTWAQTKLIGKTYHFMTKYLGTPKKDIPPKILETFEGYMGFQNGKLYMLSDSIGLVDGNRHVKLLLDHLDQKLQKLNQSHFFVCNHNILFEYGIGSFSGNDQDEMEQGIRECSKHYLHTFDRIIVSTFNEVLCFWADGTTTHHAVAAGDLTKLAGLYRNALQWKKKTPFSQAREIVEMQNHS